MKISFQYYPSAGTHIFYACEKAISIATNKNRPVRFLFNGILIKVHKRLSPQHVARQWQEQIEAKYRRYQNSSKGKAEAEKRKAEIYSKQYALNKSMDALPGLIKDQDMLMLWLKSFSQDADDTRVTFSREHLIEQLEKAGYVENDCVGEKPEWFNTRQRLARYIVGQALQCLKIGMSPHPVTGNFVDKYFTLPEV
jgi:hypothetical protein